MMIRNVCRFALLVATSLVTMLVSGCAGPWQANFEPNPDLRGLRYPPTEAVQVRTIEYERFRNYAERERELRIASPTAPQDLPPGERLAARQRLLETLQIPLPAEQVIVLGWSQFAELERLDPGSRQLANFARRVGADYVVITQQYQGPVSTIVREPVTTYARGYTTVSPGRRGRIRTASYSDTATTWVPVQVTADSFFHQAFFLRRLRPGDPLPAD
jgi:hypothetical protein